MHYRLSITPLRITRLLSLVMIVMVQLLWECMTGSQFARRLDQIVNYHQFTFTGNGQVDVCKFVGQDPGLTTDLIIYLPECDQLPTVIPIESLW